MLENNIKMLLTYKQSLFIGAGFNFTSNVVIVKAT